MNLEHLACLCFGICIGYAIYFVTDMLDVPDDE